MQSIDDRKRYAIIHSMVPQEMLEINAFTESELVGLCRKKQTSRVFQEIDNEDRNDNKRQEIQWFEKPPPCLKGRDNIISVRHLIRVSLQMLHTELSF